MEFKLAELYNLAEPLQELATVKMSATAAYRIRKLLVTVQSELQKIEEFRNDLAKRVCAENGRPDATEVPPELMMKFAEEFTKFLADETVTLEVRSINIQTITGDISPGTLVVLVDAGIVVDQEDLKNAN